MAEIGFSLVKRQRLPDRVETMDELKADVIGYVTESNSLGRSVNWQFKTNDARIKLRYLYPEL